MMNTNQLVPAAWTDLLAYVLQDDLHNRLTPRVVDIAYTAFMKAKQPNTEDGGPSDWFNDTKPTVEAMIAKIRLDLAADRELKAKLLPKSEQTAWQSEKNPEFVTTCQARAKQWKASGYKVRPLYAAPPDLDHLSAELAEVTRQRDEARQALIKYGLHRLSCDYVENHEGGLFGASTGKCDCGFAQAVEAVKEANATLCDEVKSKSRNPLFRSAADICAAGIRATAVQPCAKCEYQHGHAIGCVNNPVDITIRAMGAARLDTNPDSEGGDHD